MKTLLKILSIFKITFLCLRQAILHPCRPIIIDLPNPGKVSVESSLPWWGAMLGIVVGVITWVVAEEKEIPTLCDLAKFLIGGCIGSLFGLSIGIKTIKKILPNNKKDLDD